ncbi:hypothetical protein [Streptomyces sp. NBC_01443]|uniref:hypothetical protein n=1 Tax=Streptomyces sp. NBC_01443 TaxID=2903868 RepID=UPI002256B411|nr:hypothetical protein [Streptomyces sp. NBC_01443]MCX4627098.1 hypothetical protein [Streptomyces sp. NBC_01443]
MKQIFRLALAGLFTLVALIGGVRWGTAPAHAASVVNGQITRSEVLQRAQHWVNQRYTYLNSSDTSTWRAGPDGGKTYRRDCSGLVSMAWHLDNSYVTGDFLGGGRSWHALPGGIDALRPGDAYVNSGHMELFARWTNENDHSQGAEVYSFNNTGETVENPYAPSNFGTTGHRSRASLNNFTAIHNDRVIEDAGAMHEVSGLPTGWSDGTVTGNPTSAVSAIMVNNYRTVYSIESGGQLHERSASTGWADGYIPTNAPVSAVSAISHNGVRLVYVIENGQLHELDGGNGWADGYIPTSAPVTAVSAISINGIRLVYVVENGVVHELNGGAGWSDSPITTTGSVTSVSAVNYGGTRLLYTVQGGTVHEVNGGAGWSNIQVSPTPVGAVAAVIHNGTRIVYAVESDGRLHEFDGGNGWADGTVMTNQVKPGSLAAVSDNGLRRVYTLQ